LRHQERTVHFTTNGIAQDYESFASSHRSLYTTKISYAVDYDDEA
jgi:hypothetical protein